MQRLFDGPSTLRYPGERAAFWATAILALPFAAAIGFVIHESIGMSQVTIFLVLAMIYVTLARGRLVGSSVRITEAQYPQVFAIVQRCAASLGLPVPVVFVRDDPLVPVLAIGLGDPYALVLSSHWIEHFRDDELSFMIGRELGHIAAGHTPFTSLLSVNGNENALVSLIFGAWLRRSELTCDRVGLLCCGSLDAAMRAIVIASFRRFGRTIDHGLFAQQGQELREDSVLRLGAWIGAMPYATDRIAAMQAFMQTELYRVAEERFIGESPHEPMRLPQAGSMRVERKDCAGWWRRFGAFAIDAIVVSSILRIASEAGLAEAAPVAHLGHVTISLSHSLTSYLLPLCLALYLIVLVSLTGQTAGMMITGLRVVDLDFRRPNPVQAIWRYTIALFLWWLIALLTPLQRRVLLHDRFSGTRLVRIERVLQRAARSA